LTSPPPAPHPRALPPARLLDRSSERAANMVVPSYAAVGCRVETRDGARATVRYVGPVVGQDGEWIGVEWDDPTRGKHDGSYGGERYFECARSSADGLNPASFVRPLKIRPSVTFAEAIKAKYLDGKVAEALATGAPGAHGDGENDGGAYVESSNGQKIEIELCLKKDDPVAALAGMDRVYLPDAAVASAGDPGEASSCGVPAARVRILDLGGNLMADWPSVARFGEEFPALEELDLSGVRAAWPTVPPAGPSRFPNLAVLLLNKSGCSWGGARAVAAALPSLRELSLGGCGITTLATEGDGDASLATGLEGLKALNLEDNAIGDWSEVERLGSLPSLERLHLGGNRLDRVAYPSRNGDGASPVPFVKLEGLFLANNAVDGWDSVDALNDFPALAEVRLTGNPVTAEAATRHEIVARVGRLSQLNGSLIADQERKDAEIRYLRRVLGLVKSESAGNTGGAPEETKNVAEARAPQTGSEAVAAAHPRLQALLGSYGELSTHVTRTAGTGKMGEDMLQLTLTCVAASAGERAPQVKKVPMTITVGKLKLLCEKLFKVKADSQRLFYKEPFMGMPELLEPDDYDISYLGVRDGARILVEENE